MTPRLFLRKAAKTDIREAFEWYETRGTGLGYEFLRAVRAALATVERGPEQFAIVLDDIRRVRLLRFPYGLYYFVDGDRVVVIACTHSRRDPRRWSARR